LQRPKLPPTRQDDRLLDSGSTLIPALSLATNRRFPKSRSGSPIAIPDRAEVRSIKDVLGVLIEQGLVVWRFWELETQVQPLPGLTAEQVQLAWHRAVEKAGSRNVRRDQGGFPSELGTVAAGTE